MDRFDYADGMRLETLILTAGAALWLACGIKAFREGWLDFDRLLALVIANAGAGICSLVPAIVIAAKNGPSAGWWSPPLYLFCAAVLLVPARVLLNVQGSRTEFAVLFICGLPLGLPVGFVLSILIVFSGLPRAHDALFAVMRYVFLRVHIP